MNGFWMGWLRIWCGGVAAFGLILAGAAFEATSGPVRLIYGVLGAPDLALDAPLRFSIALMGAVPWAGSSPCWPCCAGRSCWAPQRPLSGGC